MSLAAPRKEKDEGAAMQWRWEMQICKQEKPGMGNLTLELDTTAIAPQEQETDKQGPEVQIRKNSTKLLSSFLICIQIQQGPLNFLLQCPRH